MRAERHRGAGPADEGLFGAEALRVLSEAVDDLSWLFERGYAEPGATALVGNRYQLRSRQRRAVALCACGASARARRLARRVALDALGDRPLALDGFNCIITLEAALAGGVILRARDGAHRDLSSVHGSYRRVSETETAVRLIGELLEYRAAPTVWYLDRPVSNSGRLRALIADVAAGAGWPWRIELVDSPDRVLSEQSGIIAATSDRAILDRADGWVDLPGEIIDRRIAGAWVVAP